MAFEQFLTPPKPPSRWRRLTYVVSISLHAALLIAGGFRSMWRVEEISPKGVAVTFLSGLTVPPAPPPPPPPLKQAETAVKRPRKPVQPPKPNEIVQPPEPPAAEEPAPAGSDEGETEGVAEGTPTGMEGGVVGGVAADQPPPEVPKPTADPPPLNISPRLGAGQRLSDINDPQYRPTLPPALNRPGMVVSGLFRICVSREGQVSDVKMLSSRDPDVANGWTSVIRRWQYRPLTIDGKPTRFCHPLMVQVQSIH